LATDRHTYKKEIHKEPQHTEQWNIE